MVKHVDFRSFLFRSFFLLFFFLDSAFRDSSLTALDRDANVAKFSFMEFAITTATPAQIAQNLLKTPLPTRPTKANAAEPALALTTTPNPAGNASRPAQLDHRASSTFLGGDTLGEGGLSPMVRVGTGGVIVLLKINVVNAADIRFSTTVSVYALVLSFLHARLASLSRLPYIQRRANTHIFDLLPHTAPVLLT